MQLNMMTVTYLHESLPLLPAWTFQARLLGVLDAVGKRGGVRRLEPADRGGRHPSTHALPMATAT
jgi:hypothetical protein